MARQLRRAMTVAMCLAALHQPAWSGTEETLLKLLSTRRISLGANDDAMPLAYLSPEGEHVGYHLDICRRVVQAIQQRFDLVGLKTVTVTTTQATRVPMLNNGTIDIACGHNPILASTLQLGLYAHATMFSAVRGMTLNEKLPLSLNGLGGRIVSLTVGGTAQANLRALARRMNFTVTEVTGRDVKSVLTLLESGRADVALLPDLYLMAMRANQSEPERYALLDGELSSHALGLMFRPGDEKLVALANEVIDAMMRTGELERLYRKWFTEPISGAQRPLGMPLDPRLKALFAEPGSEMLGL